MKIWFDLTNSPHINFFSHVIEELESQGHEIIITCRDLANTIELVELEGWKYAEIGGHAGASLRKKITYFPKRVFQLYRFLKKNKPDIAVSHSSFYSPITSWLLRTPSIYINDNEHAKGNYISFMFASKVLLPEFLKEVSKKKKWDKLSSVSFYPGTKEALYLSKKIRKPNTRKKEINNIYIRPEPWTAQYYKGKKFFLDKLILELSLNYNVNILPRGKDQMKHYDDKKFSSINVIAEAVLLDTIIQACDLFIGAGGTMTREIAILGIPTISIYQDELLAVDKYLIENNFMFHDKELTIEKTNQFLDSFQKEGNNQMLMKKGLIAHNLLVKNILNL
jgi:uncharacterized protein